MEKTVVQHLTLIAAFLLQWIQVMNAHNITALSNTTMYGHLSNMTQTNEHANSSMVKDSASDSATGKCSCGKYSCRCCEHLIVDEIGLDQTGCVIVGYSKRPWGVDLAVTFDGNKIIDLKISARNLPPFCFKIPKLKGLLSLCLRFYDIKWKDSVGACIKFGFKLFYFIHEDVKVGCFNFNNLGKEAQQALGLIFYELEQFSGNAQGTRPDLVLMAFIVFFGICLSSLF